MRERPILFSTPMVQAVLDGRKTMTRRVVKMTKDEPLTNVSWGYTCFTPDGYISLRGVHASGEYGESFIRNPYGKVGDRLWVRETFSEGYNYRYEGDSRIKVPHFKYRADFVGKSLDGIFVNGTPKKPVKDQSDLYVWKPSIFMPREACRINLEITGVRVERLQEITEADARDEGVGDEDAVMRVDSDILPTARLLGEPFENDRVWFAHLWNELNGKRGFGWDVNPWVWIIEFKRI